MIGSKQCYQSSPHGNKGCIVTWGGKQQNPGSALWVLWTCWTCRCSAWLCVFSTSGLDPVSLCLDNTNFVLPHCDDDGSALFSDPGDLHGGWQHSICSSRIRSSPRTLELQWLMTTVTNDYSDDTHWLHWLTSDYRTTDHSAGGELLSRCRLLAFWTRPNLFVQCCEKCCPQSAWPSLRGPLLTPCCDC